MITIQNKRLEVQIQEPGSGYRRSRFDWSGICQQITLDNSHSFCSQEATKDDPGTEGVGLSDEFGIQTPIGFGEVQPGSWFPKIGIGFLQKTTDDPYNFMLDYPMRIMPVGVERKNDGQVTFTQVSEIINGWGWKLDKNFSVNEASLTINYALENLGEKPLTTEHYNHNFIAINAQIIGPDYQLQTSFPMNFELVDGGIRIEDDVLNLTEVPPQYIYALQSDCAGLQDVAWSLVHQPSGHGIRVSECFSLFKFALWAKDYVISPEFFVWVDLQPGETQTWQREYTFF